MCNTVRNSDIKWLHCRLQRSVTSVGQWLSHTNLISLSTFFFVLCLFSGLSVTPKSPTCSQAAGLSTAGLLRNVVVQGGSETPYTYRMENPMFLLLLLLKYLSRLYLGLWNKSINVAFNRELITQDTNAIHFIQVICLCWFGVCGSPVLISAAVLSGSRLRKEATTPTP